VPAASQYMLNLESNFNPQCHFKPCIGFLSFETIFAFGNNSPSGVIINSIDKQKSIDKQRALLYS
jgi:hypothetical protein